MIDGLKPYPTMKDSCVEWLGEVPAHWEVRRLRAAFGGCINGVWGDEPNGHDDLICVRVADFDRERLGVCLENKTVRAIAPNERRHRLLQKGDLLIEKSGGGNLQPVGTVVLYDHDAAAVCSNFVARLPISPQYDARYLTYLHSHLYAKKLNVRSIKQTTGIQNLDSHSYLSEQIAFPTLAEQAAIVRFLDHAERRIRRYIRAKEKLIALLKEQKQAIIHQAVTGRIDVRTGQPYPAYKPSGVEWLGDVPANWQVLRLGRVIDLMVGFPFKSEDFSQSEEDMRLLRGINVAPGQLRWDEVVRWPADDVDRFSEYQIAVGDIILGMDRPIIGSGIRVAVANESDVPSLLLQRVACIRPARAKLTREFALRVLSSNSFLNYLTPIFTGVSVPHLSPEQIRGFWISLPSVAEQKAITKHLTSELGPVQSAAERAQSQISLLREYRTRLIADVVTGKLDVREAAAALPEVDPLAADDEADDPPQAIEEPAFDDDQGLAEVVD